jgi:hypothetical protein
MGKNDASGAQDQTVTRAKNVDRGQRKNIGLPATPFESVRRTSTAGQAKGADTYQGPISTSPRAIRDGSGVSQRQYRTSPSLGVVDQKPGVAVQLQKDDDNETSGTRLGIADGSNRVKNPTAESFFRKAPISTAGVNTSSVNDSVGVVLRQQRRRNEVAQVTRNPDGVVTIS